MPKFGQASLNKLATCDVRLQKVFNEVIKHWDCTIIEGHRDEQTQNEYFRTGKSERKWPNGEHNKIPSKAVDAAPYFKTSPHIRWNDVESFAYFAGFVIGIAASMGIKLRHGADWDQDRDIRNTNFMDWPHFELAD